MTHSCPTRRLSDLIPDTIYLICLRSEPDPAFLGKVGLINSAGAERSCDSTCRHAGFRLSQANGVDPGELRTVPQRVHSATPPRPRRTWPLAFGGYQPSQTLQTLEHPCDRSSAQQFECGLAKQSSLRRRERSEEHTSELQSLMRK